MMFPYMALIDKELHRPASKWCAEQWGTIWDPIDNRGGLWCMFWAAHSWSADNANSSNGKYRVHFKTEEQYVWFTLRWGA
jgi:hypothetical protein